MKLQQYLVKYNNYQMIELRDQSRIFKEEIISSYKMISDEVHELKQKASSANMSIQDKEALFEKVESLEKG